MPHTFNTFRPLTSAFLLIGLLLSLSGCEKIPPTIPIDTDTAPQPLTVMTYNVYLGSSTEPVLNVKNLLQVPTAVANVYNTFLASDFPGRAKAIATSIKANQPHLIGLQEMSLIRRQFPGDRITGGSVPAEEVVMDFRTVLLEALKAEGLTYRIAAQVENIDVEMPMLTETEGIVDVRLTDYDVILARNDVATSDPTGVNYIHTFGIEMLGLEVKRGYTAVDATVDGVTYRFVNTHLESFDPDARLAQTHELIESLSDETLPIVLLGDFNTPGPDGAGYQLLIQAEYIDTWQADTAGLGNTCCQEKDLRNEMSGHFERIDLIFVGNAEADVSVLTIQTVGDTPLDKLASGVWPSDHAGVVAELLF